MPGINLAFGKALEPKNGRVDLAFGTEESSGAITINGHLPPPTSRIVVGRLFQASIAATLAPPAANIRVFYDISVWNGVAAKQCALAEDAARAHVATVSAFQQGERLRVPKCTGTLDAARLDASTIATGTPAPLLPVRRCSGFDDAARLEAAAIAANVPLQRAHIKRCGTFDDAVKASSGLIAAQHFLYQRHVRLCSGFDDGAWRHKANCGGFGYGLPLFRKTCSRFEKGLPASWGTHPIIPPPPIPGLCYTPPVGFVALAFGDALPANSDLAFICLGHVQPGETLIVPVRRVYIVINSAILIRLPSMQEIPAHSLRISTDADSWTWGFSAEIAASALDMVSPENGDPVDVQATINGITWRFIVEKIRRNREFGKSTLTISGRSRTAWLAAPYAAQSNHSSAIAITAQQIIDAALPNGWTLDWNVDDWLIPDGVWSAYSTPMEVALKVSGAIAGVLQSHRTDQNLILGRRYPVSPWELPTFTPDIQIPAAVMVTEGIEWTEKPAWNAVYVSGENQGIIGHVKRAGSAADLIAPMQTDSLITAIEAARQRGTAILGDTGRQAIVTVDLPLMPDHNLGLITPGMVMEIVDGAEIWRGYARGVSINATLPKVRQTIEIERPIP